MIHSPFFLLALLVMLACVPVIGNLILGPVNRAAGRLNAPTRFQLSDFLWLLVLIQIALSYCVQGVGVDLRGVFYIILGFLMFASLAIWAGAISFMSRAGVSHPLRRGCFILVQLPGTLAMMMALPILAMAGLFMAGQHLYRRTIDGGVLELPMLVFGVAVAVGGSFASLLAGWLLRRMAIWIVSASPSPDANGGSNKAELGAS